MKHEVFTLTILIMVIGFFSSCNKEIDYQKEEEKIKEVWNKISEYGAKGDWENYSKYFVQTEKLQIIHPGNGEWLDGWDEFAKKYKSMMDDRVVYTIEKNEIKIYNISKCGDMAWALIDVVFSFDANPDNKFHMWESGVFEKIDGEWKAVMGFASGVKRE